MPRQRNKKTNLDYIDLTGDTSDEEELKPSKRKRNTTNTKEPKAAPEKRTDVYGSTVRFQAKASVKTLERIARAMPGGHRLFLIDRKVIREVGAEGGAEEEFSILGATGNCYKVIVGRHPSCNCPDCERGNVCKHMLFVMLRVLRLGRDNPLVWQRALLSSEVDTIFSGQGGSSQAGSDVLASVAVRSAFRGMTSASGSGEQRQGQRPIAADDECPICQDLLSQGRTETVNFCFSCGNNVHCECISHWVSSRRSSGLEVTCPFCRSEWRDGKNPGAGGSNRGSGGGHYVNLANVSEAHRNADTSLEGLYGDRSIWIRANQGNISRRHAAGMWQTLNGR